MPINANYEYGAALNKYHNAETPEEKLKALRRCSGQRRPTRDQKFLEQT